MVRHFLFTFLVAGISFTACKRHNYTDCPPEEDILQTFVTTDGETALFAEDGRAYLKHKGRCEFVEQYFDPNFFALNYQVTDSGTYIITDQGDLFPTNSNFSEDFEGYAQFTSLFPRSITDTHLVWTGFTAQSPDFPTVADYVALRQCVLAGTCQFTDNRIELAADPVNANNTVLRCTAVKPTGSMVTSKASIESELPFFRFGDDLWFQARYYLQSGQPYSLVDFENPYFVSSPGPRIYLQNFVPGFENKFSSKLKYLSDGSVLVPNGQWFTLKTHIQFSDLENGLYQIWINGQEVLNTTAITLPLRNSIQASLEVGISATQEATVLLVDDIRLSNQPF